MRRIEAHFADYAAHHRHSLNKATHSVGIPLIVIALLGLASRISVFTIIEGLSINLGLLLALALIVVYLTWHAGLALGVAVLCVPAYLIGSTISAFWLWIVLIVGVSLQYVGHFVFEKRSPAFHKNAVHTLVGPLWMAALLFQALGLYRPRGSAD